VFLLGFVSETLLCFASMSRSQLLLRFNVPHHVFLVVVVLHHFQRPLSATKGSSFLPQRTAKHPKTFGFSSHTASPMNREAPKNLWFSLTQLLVVVALHPSQWSLSATKVLAFSLQPSTKHSKVPPLIFKYQTRTTFVCFAKI